MTHDFKMMNVTNPAGEVVSVIFRCLDCNKDHLSRRAAQMHKNMMKRWHSNEQTNSQTANETETSGTTGNVGSQ